MFQGVVPKDIVNLIVEYFPDGQTAAWFGATCKRFHEVVHGNYKAIIMMEAHLIWTDDLEQTLLVEPGKPLFSEATCNKTFFQKLLGSILYFNHEFNISLVKKFLENYQPDSFSESLSGFLEGLIRPGFARFRHESFRFFGDESGNLVFCSDFYGHDHGVQGFSMEHLEIYPEFFKWFESFFPGTVSWRLINFPRTEQYAYMTEFHRGTSLQLIFKSCGHGVPHPDILSFLKKTGTVLNGYYRLESPKKKAKQIRTWHSVPVVTLEARFLQERSKFIKK